MIDPITWQAVATVRAPKPCFMTDWFDGMTHPQWVGYYERHFTDSAIVPMASIQYWDGKYWRARPDSPPHWRQVGDYPAWRGLTEAQYRLQTRSEA